MSRVQEALGNEPGVTKGKDWGQSPGGGDHPNIFCHCIPHGLTSKFSGGKWKLNGQQESDLVVSLEIQATWETKGKFRPAWATEREPIL